MIVSLYTVLFAYHTLRLIISDKHKLIRIHPFRPLPCRNIVINVVIFAICAPKIKSFLLVIEQSNSFCFCQEHFVKKMTTVSDEHATLVHKSMQSNKELIEQNKNLQNQLLNARDEANSTCWKSSWLSWIEAERITKKRQFLSAFRKKKNKKYTWASGDPYDLSREYLIIVILCFIQH